MHPAVVLRNLTPHLVVIHLADGTRCELAAESPTPRCVVYRAPTTLVQTQVGPIPVVETQLLADVIDLPEAQPGILLIVSSRVAEARPLRDDLVFPGEAVRDPNTGRVVGCRSLARLPMLRDRRLGSAGDGAKARFARNASDAGTTPEATSPSVADPAHAPRTRPR